MCPQRKQMDFRISIHRLYFKIAVEHQRQYEVHNSRLKHLETKGIAEEELSTIEDEMMGCYTNREQSAIIVVTKLKGSEIKVVRPL